MRFASDADTQICIFGDCHARTGSLDMFLIDENICNNLNFDRNMFTYQVDSKANMLPCRSSMDKKVNNYGRRLIELCKNSGLCIVNGRGKNQNSQNVTCKKGESQGFQNFNCKKRKCGRLFY